MVDLKPRIMKQLCGNEKLHTLVVQFFLWHTAFRSYFAHHFESLLGLVRAIGITQLKTILRFSKMDVFFVRCVVMKTLKRKKVVKN